MLINDFRLSKLISCKAGVFYVNQLNFESGGGGYVWERVINAEIQELVLIHSVLGQQ